MASIDPSAGPGAAAAARAHAVELGVERTGMGIVGAAGLTGATSMLGAAPAIAYGVGAATGHAIRHPRADAIASHAAGVAEGVLHGVTGAAGHAAAAATTHAPGLLPHWKGVLGRAAHTVGKVVPAVLAGVGFIDVTTTLDTKGARALVTTQDGRNGVINAIGGGLLLLPHPALKLAGAGVMATGLANDLGGLRRLDAPH